MPINNPTSLLLKTVSEDSINGIEVRLTDELGVVIPSKLRSILVPSAAFTANGNTAAIQPQGFHELMLFLRLSAVAGTFTAGQGLNLFLDSSDDGGTTWFQVAQLGPTNIQAAPANNPYPSTYVLTLNSGQANGFGDTFRIRWTVVGTTPSFTFQVTGIYKQ